MVTTRNFTKLYGVLVWLSCWACSAAACVVDADPSKLAEQLHVTSSNDRIDLDDDVRVMTTLGSIENLSDACAKNIVVEVSYYDAKNQLVDVLTQTLTQVTVLSKSNALFRVRGQISAPSELYVSSKVRIVAADVKLNANRSPAKESTWLNTIVTSWSPLLLLIAVWLWMYRRSYGPNAASTQAITLMAEQVRQTTAQNQLLTKLTEVLVQARTSPATDEQ